MISKKFFKRKQSDGDFPFCLSASFCLLLSAFSPVVPTVKRLSRQMQNRDIALSVTCEFKQATNGLRRFIILTGRS